LKIGDIIIVKKIAENSKYYSLEQLPTINGAVVILNPKTGEILSMIGGYMDKAGAFNRAVQAFRQMGSTIKPFVYATALERGFTLTSIFMDADITL
jgi:penicillin-binding protein 1A